MALDWPYHFVSASRDATTRRGILDATGVFAAVISSVFVLGAIVQATYAKAKGRTASSDTWNLSALTGQKEPHAAAFAVASWGIFVFYIVQLDTADDYLHITRSPAQVATALLASNIFLSLAPLRVNSPSIISYHRLQSLLIFALFVLHGALYVNFYVQNGLLIKRVQDVDVQLGIGMIWLSLVLWYSGARIASLRAKLGVSQARLLHVVLTALLGTMLWFHVGHARANVKRASAFWLLGQGWRVVQMLRPQAPRKERTA